MHKNKGFHYPLNCAFKQYSRALTASAACCTFITFFIILISFSASARANPFSASKQLNAPESSAAHKIKHKKQNKQKYKCLRKYGKTTQHNIYNKGPPEGPQGAPKKPQTGPQRAPKGPLRGPSGAPQRSLHGAPKEPPGGL